MSAPWLVLTPSRLEARALGEALGSPPRACGVGLVAAALGVAAAVAEERPAGVLLLGLAGTRDPDRAALGRLVVGGFALNEGVGAGAGEGFVPLGAMGIPDEPAPPDRLSLADPGPPAEGLLRGGIGCVAATSASPAEAAARRRAAPDVLVEEMEGWAAAVACRAAGVPLAVVRAVSNVAGDRDMARWDLAGSLAALGRFARRAREARP